MSVDYQRARLEVKALNKGQFEGYGSVFGNIDFGNDIVAHGAFQASLRDHESRGTMPSMFWMHQPDRVPGKWVEMREDDRGLYVKGELADTPLGNEMGTLLRMDAVSGLSIGYRPTDVDVNDDGVRVIKTADLLETSIVSIPMNDRARVDLVKSLVKGTERELELKLRDAGFSRNTAKTIVASMFDLRDAVEDDDDELTDSLARLAGKFDDEVTIALRRFTHGRGTHRSGPPD